MGRKNKYSKEIKTKAVEEYIKGIKSINEIAQKLGCGIKSIRVWVMMYKKYGTDIFDEKPNNQSYTKEFKEKVVKEYLDGKGSILSLKTKYKILSDNTLRNWILKYNNGITCLLQMYLCGTK